MTTVFLLVGASSFPDPGNWNPINTVEVVGAGSNASRARTGPPCPTYYAGSGGSGGGYGIGHNRTDPFPVALLITPHSGNLYSGTVYYTNWADPGGYTATSGNQTRGGVYAGNAGLPNQNFPGNASQTGVAGGPDAGYAGGTGGASSAGTTAWYGGGGGGAGGPHGAGSNGGNNAATTTIGGASDNGTVAGGTGAGGAGLSGTQWDASHGTGSGGAGATGTGLGGTAGQYGGGGGGCGNGNTGAANGGDGIIVLTYTPIIPPPTVQAMVLT